MSFSEEAKDFISSFKTTGKFINDYQLNQSRKKYYDALAKKAGTPDPVESAFDKGAKSYKGFKTDISAPDAGQSTGPALTSVDQLDTDLGSPNAGGAKPDEAMPTSIDDVDTNFDSAGALPEYDETNLMAGPSESDMITPTPMEPPTAMTGLYSSGGIVKRLRAYYGGGMVKGYAGGGVVEDDDAPEATGAPTPLVTSQPADDDPEFGYEPFPAAEGAEGSAPDMGASAPGGEGGASPEVRLPQPKRRDTLLGMALHGSTMFLQDMFSMRDTQPQGALPVDPGAANPEGGKFMFAGVGAASKDDYDQVMKVVDPNGRLDDNIRNIAGIKAVYDYYLKRGDIDKANKAAASLVQYTRNVSAEFGGQALEAYKRGDLKGAAELVEKGYNQIPDGNRLDVTMTRNGGGYVRQLNEDGDVIQQGPFSPQELLQAATGMKNGSAFWQNIVASAQRQLGNQPSDAYRDALQRLYGLDENGQGPDGTTGGAMPTDGAGGQTGGDGGHDVAGAASTPASLGAGGGSGAPGVTSPGNPSGDEPEGPPMKPKPEPIVRIDPKLLRGMSRQEAAQIISATAAENRARAQRHEKAMKEWGAAVQAYRANASRIALQRASVENTDPHYGEDKGAIPEFDDAKIASRGVDTGETFGPDVVSTDQNVMGVIDDAPPELAEPKYRKFSTDPALSKADQLTNRAEVNQINSQLTKDYTSKKAEQAKARKDALAGGVKPGQRAEVESAISDAWETNNQVLAAKNGGKAPGWTPEQSEVMKSAAYGLYSYNDMTGSQAVRTVLSLTTVKKDNPRALNFEARDTKDGFIHVSVSGQQLKMPKNTFNQLAQIRLDEIRRAEAGAAADKKKADARAKLDADPNSRKSRQALRGVPRAGGVATLKGKGGAKVDDSAVDKRQRGLTDLAKRAGRAIGNTFESAAKTYDEDFAKRK